MTTAERVRELLDWDAAWMNTRPDIQPWIIFPYTIEDLTKNHFDRQFQKLIEWAEQHPEELEDGR